MLKTFHDSVNETTHDLLADLIFAIFDEVLSWSFFKDSIECALDLAMRCKNMELLPGTSLDLLQSDLLLDMVSLDFNLPGVLLILSIKWDQV